MAGLHGAGTPASTVFVGNLAYEVSEQQLIDYFSQVGPVKTIRIVTERETGKPRGFGFIEFYDIPTAESAIRNLNATELMGRQMRIVFAEGGPPGSADYRPRREDDRDRDRFGDDRGRRPPPPRNRLVGADLAYHASHGTAALLGQPAAPGAPADAITSTLARKTRSDLWEYLAQMKALVQQNPAQARQILVQHPQLTKALFQMEVILGLVANPLGDVAPKGVAPPDLLPRGGGPPAQQQQPVQPQQPAIFVPAGPGGVPLQPAGPQLVGVMEQPLQPGMLPAQQQPMQYLSQQPAGGMLAPPGAPNGLPMQGYAPGTGGPPAGQQILQAPPGMAQPPPGYILAPAPGLPQSVPQQAFAPPMAAPQPQPAPVDPRMTAAAAGGGPVDPRARAGAGGGPGPMMSAQQPPQQPAAAPQQAGAPAQGMTPEVQQALLQQVMSLTPQQIELLPPQQKAQVLALQAQLRGQGQM